MNVFVTIIEMMDYRMLQEPSHDPTQGEKDIIKKTIQYSLLRFNR